MKAFRALLLVLVISVCAYAGDIPFGKDGEMPNGVAGEMPCGKAGDIPFGKDGNIPFDKASTPSLSTELTVYLLQSVLPLF